MDRGKFRVDGGICFFSPERIIIKPLLGTGRKITIDRGTREIIIARTIFWLPTPSVRRISFGEINRVITNSEGRLKRFISGRVDGITTTSRLHLIAYRHSLSIHTDRFSYYTLVSCTQFLSKFLNKLFCRKFGSNITRIESQLREWTGIADDKPAPIVNKTYRKRT